MLRHLLRGAAAGAAGTTALNAVTYLDMALRGRPASDTPQRTVAAVVDRMGIRIPDGHRLDGLAGLSGMANGVALGVLLGGARGLGLPRLSRRWGSVMVGLAAVAASAVPMARLGVTDPRQWTASEWLSDLVPHLVFGAVVVSTLEALQHSG